jgi:hypothetical protein
MELLDKSKDAYDLARNNVDIVEQPNEKLDLDARNELLLAGEKGKSNVCYFCNKVFTRISSCNNHMIKCKVLHNSPVCNLPSNKCVCNHSYKYKQNLARHQKDCQEYKDYITSTTNLGDVNGTDNVISTITGKDIVSNINSNNTTIHNQTINNTTNNPTIQINPLGHEDFSHITQDDIKRILNSGHGAFKELISLVYELPANLNLCFANKKENRIFYLKHPDKLDIDNAIRLLTS